MDETDTARAVRIIRARDPQASARETVSVRLVGPSGDSLLSASLTPLHEQHDQPVAAQFARWEALRARYGG